MYTIILLTTTIFPSTPPTQKEIEIALNLTTSASRKRIWNSPVDYPEGMFKYSRGEHTQSIFISGNSHVLDRIDVRNLDKKWMTSGGMKGISGWISEKYKYIPEGKDIKTWIGPIKVSNGSGFQDNLGIKRSYPNGTRFDDVLINKETGEVFEHRSVEKIDGKWKRGAIYENEKARPKGYTGLNQSCVSCHREAGTGVYGQGLVPGGDTIISDPLDFNVWPTDRGDTENTDNPWQWTEEDGGYWWRWENNNALTVNQSDIKFAPTQIRQPRQLFQSMPQQQMFSAPIMNIPMFQPRGAAHCTT